MYYEGTSKAYDVPCRMTHYFYEIPFKDDDLYITVDENYENRLDKVAYDYYNTVLLWWVIAQASNIRNPLYVPVGTVLRIPSYSTLFTLKGIEI
jgi:hypothetical protein